MDGGRRLVHCGGTLERRLRGPWVAMRQAVARAREAVADGQGELFHAGHGCRPEQGAPHVRSPVPERRRLTRAPQDGQTVRFLRIRVEQSREVELDGATVESQPERLVLLRDVELAQLLRQDDVALPEAARCALLQVPRQAKLDAVDEVTASTSLTVHVEDRQDGFAGFAFGDEQSMPSVGAQ